MWYLPDTSGNLWKVQRIRDRIEAHTGTSIPIFPRSLESGPAEYAGADGYLIPVTSLETLVVFTVPQEPDNEVEDDLLSHARSAEASGTIVLFPSGVCMYSHREREPGGWISTLWSSLTENEENLNVETYTDEHTEVRGKLTRYLGELRKDLNGFIYRRDGETSHSLRELTVQTLMNQVLLTRIVYSQGGDPGSLHERTLLGRLFTYAVCSPVHDQYDIRIPSPNPAEVSHTTQKLASISSPALSGIRISWIEPGTWASAFCHHLSSIPHKQTKRRKDFSPENIQECDDVLNTRAGKFIANSLIDDTYWKYPGRIYDPSSGCGELIALVMRLIRINKVPSGRIDTITSRLIIASDIIHATDFSPVRIAIVRFIIVNWILGGEIRDPSLSNAPLCYPFQVLSDHIRPGCILFNHDLVDEFVSETAGYPIFRHIHPLNPADLIPEGEKFSLILTSPSCSLPDSSPEIMTYLTRRYQSYLKGVHPAALFVERTQELTTPEGRSVIFIPSSWHSEAPFRGFRRLISRILPASVIIEEGPSGEIDRSELSVIIGEKTGDDRLHVIRLQTARSGDSSPVRCFSVQTDDLPEDDGWQLDDPWENELLDVIRQGQMSLSEYLFDEIYPGCSVRGDTRSPKGWTSITGDGGDIRVHQGDGPEPDAIAIIPGQDQYLTGLLTSSLMRWYVQVLFRRDSPEGPDTLNLIKNLPIRTLDLYNEQESRTHFIIEQIMSRITMLSRQNRKSHSWHDRERFCRQITAAQEELDRIISTLYGVSAKDCHEIRSRIRL